MLNEDAWCHADELNTQLIPTFEQKLSFKGAFIQITKLSVPYAGALFISMVGELVTVKIIAELGTDDLAASGLISSTQAFFITPTLAMFNAIPMQIGEQKLISNRYNPYYPDRAAKIYQRGIALALILSIPICGITVFIRPILEGLGQSPEFSSLAQDFFRGKAYGIPFTMCLAVNQQMAMGLALPNLATITTISNTLLVGALGYLFAFGKYGFPNTGLQGLGYAYSISAIVNYILSTLYLKFSKEFKPYHIFYNFNLRNLSIFSLYRKSFPILIQTAVETASLSVPILYVGWMGTDQLTAQQLVVPYFYIFSMPYLAVSQTIVGLTSNQIKNNQFHKVQQYSKTAILLCVITSGIGFLFFITMPNQMCGFFIDTQDPDNAYVLSLARTLFLIHGAELMVDSVRTIASSLIRGMQDADFPAIATFASTVICLGLGYCLGFQANWGVSGVYGARDLGLATGTTLLLRHWFKKKAALANSADNHHSVQIQETQSNWFSRFFPIKRASRRNNERSILSSCFNLGKH